MPTARPLTEWVRIYEEKTGDTAALPKGFRLFYLAERGFAMLMADPESRIMFVWQVCGDGKFWRDFAELQCAAADLDYICTICTREILPYIRGFGWKIVRQEERDGKRRFSCRDSVGRKVLITHMCLKDDGRPQYYVTHYLNKLADAPEEEVLKGADAMLPDGARRREGGREGQEEGRREGEAG